MSQTQSSQAGAALDPFGLADKFVDDVVAIAPQVGTAIGASGVDHLWNDYSPAGDEAAVELARAYRKRFAEHLDHPDRWQRHAARVCHDFQIEAENAYDLGLRYLSLRHVAGIMDEIRDVFDLMNTSTAEGWENVAARLETVDQALAGATATYEEGRERGEVAARLQVESTVEQARHLSGTHSKWLMLAKAADGATSPDVAERVAKAVDGGRAAMGRFADYLETDYLPGASAVDGVGRERYIASADRFLGLTIDPIETYEWGWEEVNRLQQAMLEAARIVDPEASLPDVIERLENDPAYAVASQAEFVDFIQGIQDRALGQLDGVHFDVPPEIRQVTVNLVPPGSALGAYYLQPTEDFTRPGGIWYSFGEKQQLPLWSEVSTAYHEGFPGHHLQVGTAMTLRENLSRAHRLLVWYSGFGEGWALYTERLMDELGYFDQPHYLLGMLASQQMRACRVVIDIGCHLGLRIPESAVVAPGEVWSYDSAVETLHRVAGIPLDVSHSEVKRYLGWPGQAISYKVGERHILRIREEAQRAQGSSFNLKEFHRALLGWGDLRLDYLGEITARDAVA
jgi:uncharacterized protein (DUF885 family)